MGVCFGGAGVELGVVLVVAGHQRMEEITGGAT